MVGDISDFDVDELRSFTRYEGGYFDQHLTIHKFWRIVKDMSPADRRKFLKFATSCSKAPVGGFSHLSPPFTIRFVSEDQVNTSGDATSSPVTQFFTSMFGIGKDMTRLPTASTCFNLLKLPAYKNKSTLKEKLLYAINASSGFELS